MKKRLLLTGLFIVVIIIASTTGLALAQGLGPKMLAAALGTGFNFQGRLSDGGAPANGSYDFSFFLYDDPSAGNQVGPNLTLEDIPVSQGVFNASLDFGDVYDGTALYLEVQVRPGASVAAYTPLAPRQALSATPYALFAAKAPWSGLTGMPAGFSDGVDDVGSSVQVPVFSRTTVDYTGWVGYSSSIAIGVDGFGLISHVEYANKDLKITHCLDINCTQSESFTIDSSSGVNSSVNTSIAIGADGLGLVSYYDYDTTHLKVAHCNDIPCSSASIYTLDSSNYVGIYSSIAIGADGLGLISYFDGTYGDLKVAHCNNTVCSSATTSTLDSGGTVGFYTDIVIGADGLGLISYYDSTNGDLKVAHCYDLACGIASVYTLDTPGSTGLFTSIAIGGDGLGLISYADDTNYNLKVAHCNNTACSSANTLTVDSIGTVGYYSSITVGPDGLGLISYSDLSTYNLKVLHCGNANCSDYNLYVIDSSYYVGQYTSIAIGTDGLGLISYQDYNFNDLKVLHCDEPLCSP